MEARLKRVVGAFSSNPTYDDLLYKLAELALEWRATKDDKLARRYQAVLVSLLELGWNEELDTEFELPNRLMPEEYFQRYEQVHETG